MYRLLVTALIIFACSCASDPPCSADSSKVPVLTDTADRDEFIGTLVTIRGKVINSKIPTIIGVDVRSSDPDLRGQQGEATGILERWVVTPEEIEEADYAHRGPGVFYRLKDQDSVYAATAHRVSLTTRRAPD